MIDTIIELLTQVKDELLYNEDRWGTLTVDQTNKLIHIRCKVVYVIAMLEGVKKCVDGLNNLIRYME